MRIDCTVASRLFQLCMFNPGCTFTSIRNCNKGTQLGCQQFEHYKMFLKKYFRKVPVYALTLTPSCILQQNIVSLSNIGILILCLLGAWLITISMKELGFFWFFFFETFPHIICFQNSGLQGPILVFYVIMLSLKKFDCILLRTLWKWQLLMFQSEDQGTNNPQKKIQFQGKLRLHIYQN